MTSYIYFSSLSTKIHLNRSPLFKATVPLPAQFIVTSCVSLSLANSYFVQSSDPKYKSELLAIIKKRYLSKK